MSDREKFDELKALATPLQKWLAKNFNPHCKVEVTTDSVEVLSGEMRIPLEYPYND
jgi:hypothetical protein